MANSSTTNYGLYVTDDLSEKIIIWRDKMNGLQNSNMTIIDEVLGDKIDEIEPDLDNNQLVLKSNNVQVGAVPSYLPEWFHF